ncbi:MAG: SGNH/GDSL hydrolase family protein [Armatimonadota bacterium]
MKPGGLLLALALVCSGAVNGAQEQESAIVISGDWEITVTAGTLRLPDGNIRLPDAVALKVAPPPVLRLSDTEKLPLWKPDAPGWTKGLRLKEVRTFETSAPDHLVPGSLTVRSTGSDHTVYRRGTDYEVDEQWGTVGRLEGGAIREDTEVRLDYSVWLDRLDSIVVLARAGGQPFLRPGEPGVVTVRPPDPGPGEVVLANIWVRAGQTRLTDESVYRIIEPAYPEKKHWPPPAQRLLPKTWEKLNTGGSLKILAWGDSVTAGGEVPEEHLRWQNRFLGLLKQQFPRADIRLETLAWGGRNTESFLKVPTGSPYNFEEKVLGARPDLIISEFVNDANLTPDQVEERYGCLLRRFREIGAEWVILTPHFVWHRWMGVASPRVEKDPRPYVAGLRRFAEKNGVALADASLRWGHLVKEGLPYETLLANSLNHPDERGHLMFALSLMELFQ